MCDGFTVDRVFVGSISGCQWCVDLSLIYCPEVSEVLHNHNSFIIDAYEVMAGAVG